MNNSNKILSSNDWVDKKRKVTVTPKARRSPSSLHMHDYFEIELVLDGYGTQNLNGRMYELSRGTVSFLSPIDFHEVIPKKELQLINVSFDNNTISPKLLTALINHDRDFIIQLQEDEITRFKFFTDLLADNHNIDDEHSETNIKNLLECLLILIIRNGISQHDSKSNDDVLPMYKCMRYIFLHFAETPSLDDIAKISGYSTNYFSKQFHDITGKKYIDFLTSLKLNHAKLMLTSTKKTVIDISSSCGFTSLSNFNRIFKKETGLSPTEYRVRNTYSK